MNGDGSPALPRPLDPRSRAVLLQFAMQLCWFAVVAFLPTLAGLLSPADSVAALTSYCSCGALFQVFMATWNGQRPGGPSLNSWDLCLALVGVCVMTHAAHQLMAPG